MRLMIIACSLPFRQSQYIESRAQLRLLNKESILYIWPKSTPTVCQAQYQTVKEGKLWKQRACASNKEEIWYGPETARTSHPQLRTRSWRFQRVNYKNQQPERAGFQTLRNGARGYLRRKKTPKSHERQKESALHMSNTSEGRYMSEQHCWHLHASQLWPSGLDLTFEPVIHQDSFHVSWKQIKAKRG